MKHLKIFIFFAATVLMFAACSENKTSLNYEFNTYTGSPAAYPNASFAVISDIHVYDASLGSTGEAFEKVMNADRKLLLDSIDLLDLAIDNIIEQGVNFVIVSGDLTKDGEFVNHLVAVNRLARLASAGISVYAVPGNHDYNNPDAVSFNGGTTEPVRSISKDDFKSLYGDLFYNNAIYKDANSLSYAAEPIEGLWLLALDSTRCSENVPGQGEIVSGNISPETLNWMTMVLREAANRDKAVIAVMHHGAMEHWKGHSKLHPDYIIPDFENFSKFLSSWNVRVVFTGHYHANDITRSDFGSKFIYDIETGSLITAPCPVRYISINNNIINIRTDFIAEKLHPGTDFAANAGAFVKRTVMLEAEGVLRKYKVSDKDIAIITDAVGDAFAAHYNGDEDPSLRPTLDKSKLGLWGRFILGQQQYVLDGMWQDLPPQDNNVTFHLY